MERQKCLVYSRVVGYLRPVSQWHIGKKSEYVDRQVFKVDLEPVAKQEKGTMVQTSLGTI